MKIAMTFETASLILLIVNLGKYIESNAKHKIMKQS